MDHSSPSRNLLTKGKWQRQLEWSAADADARVGVAQQDVPADAVGRAIAVVQHDGEGGARAASLPREFVHRVQLEKWRAFMRP